ncbi:hypothetical protein TSAR_013733 [Trichomalopsis sarcophagae]|uniref:Uncharacterized protein n=1 Tax=Trichomalopsis sarcophagae TaxID=543379 RepID=A0A232ETB9_9HYME|nr:hypothetical protein TSAR_013733 [Trichomalopsis sarcophagae]
MFTGTTGTQQLVVILQKCQTTTKSGNQIWRCVAQSTCGPSRASPQLEDPERPKRDNKCNQRCQCDKRLNYESTCLTQSTAKDKGIVLAFNRTGTCDEVAKVTRGDLAEYDNAVLLFTIHITLGAIYGVETSKETFVQPTISRFASEFPKYIF